MESNHGHRWFAFDNDDPSSRFSQKGAAEFANVPAAVPIFA